MSTTLRALELNSAVKYKTHAGLRNDFPITFEYDSPKDLQVFIGFKLAEKWDIVYQGGVPCVHFPELLELDLSVTIRRATPADGVPHTYHYTGNAKGGAEFNAKTIDENFKFLTAIVSEVEDYNTIAQDNLDGIEEEFKVTQERADEAYSKAEDSLKESSLAKAEASEAKEASKKAEGLAQEANKTADKAESTAESAKTTANKALTTAEGSVASSKEAIEIAERADAKADTAITKAEASNATSSNAISIARDAQKVAQGIDDKAQEALDTSKEAESLVVGTIAVAEEAKEIASNIDGKAQTALDTSTEAKKIAQDALDATTGDFIVQELGDSDAKVISQKVVTEEFNKLQGITEGYRKLDDNNFIGPLQVNCEDDGAGTGIFFFNEDKETFRSNIVSTKDGLQFNVNVGGELTNVKVPNDGGSNTIATQEWVTSNSKGIGKIIKESELSTAVEGVQKDISEVQTDVADAKKLASDANSTAISAQTTAKAAQSTANVATSKADTAQRRADSAYSLANGKWNPQATTGTGNLARMSEVNKKRDTSDVIFPSLTLRPSNPTGDAILMEGVGGRCIMGFNRPRNGSVFLWMEPDNGDGYNINFPSKPGTIALTSDIPSGGGGGGGVTYEDRWYAGNGTWSNTTNRMMFIVFQVYKKTTGGVADGLRLYIPLFDTTFSIVTGTPVGIHKYHFWLPPGQSFTISRWNDGTVEGRNSMVWY